MWNGRLVIYRVRNSTRKLSVKIIVNLLDMSNVNTWILMTDNNKCIQRLKMHAMLIAEQLLKESEQT